MGLIQSPGLFTSQPQYPAQADQSQGVIKAFIPANGNATPIGGITPIIGPDGVGFRATSQTAYYQASTTRIISGLPQWAIVAAFRTTQSIGGNGSALYCERGSSGLNILKLEGLGNSVPYLQMTIRDDPGNLIQFAGSSTVTNDGKFHVAVGVQYATNDHRLFIDGRQEVSNGGSVTNAFTGSVESRIASDAADPASFITGPIYLVALLNRAPSPAEIASVGLNPWKLFKAPARKLWVVPTSSGINLIGANSSQANTSSTGAISQTHILTGANSSQANTASAAAISQGSTLSGANASQANAGSAAAITQVQILAGANSAQSNLGSAGAITLPGAIVLVGANAIQVNLGAAGAITQVQALIAAMATQANACSVGAITNSDIYLPPSNSDFVWLGLASGEC